MCGGVGARREAVVAMRMSVVMHCAVAFWWGAVGCVDSVVSL